MGFGALAENVSNYNFSNLIMMELVDSFHIPDSTIRTNIGRIKVDATKVGHALGLNVMGGLYRQKMLKKEVPREQYEAADKFKKKSSADLRNMVTQIQLDTEEDITNFKRAFILYVQKAILCPNNSKPLSPKTLPTILDVTNPRAMNWGRHVYSFLLNGITKMKKKNLKSADGYVIALLIIYFQETHFGVDSEEADAQPPWLDVCSVKRRTKKRHEAINAEPLQPPQHAEADANPAAAVGENVGIIERRTKKRHEAINAAPLRPPQQGETDANPDAAIDALVDPSSQANVTLSSDVEIKNITPLGDTETQEHPTKDADSVAAMAVEEDDTQHDAVIVDATIATVPPKHIVPAAAMGVESAEEEDTAIVDASIVEPLRVIEEAALTDLVERITTHQHVALEKNLEKSVTRPEEEASEQELTLRDLPEIQKATSLQKQPVIVMALEKAGDKESVAVPRELEKAELT
ncbi:hypothetical protein PIB30_049151 [Stylosanthes scabra]|uniref:DUF1985 domain-containing protein n=1 Tax=Stylosanthes scabra TaxID=79078 RepID=A0ABU6ZFZ5_9FABA|nr:hypothetical protein [Stylosanthes scabra]